jgi:hypothetical protein
MCARAKSQETIVTIEEKKERNFTYEFLIQWWANKTEIYISFSIYLKDRQTDRQTSAWSYSYLLSSFAYMQIFLASCLMTICHWHTRTFFLHNIANVILHTCRIHISFDHFYFLFFLVFKQAASIVFLLDIYTISLYGSHILLTFLSLNLVKRTLIEL